MHGLARAKCHTGRHPARGRGGSFVPLVSSSLTKRFARVHALIPIHGADRRETLPAIRPGPARCGVSVAAARLPSNDVRQLKTNGAARRPPRVGWNMILS